MAADPANKIKSPWRPLLVLSERSLNVNVYGSLDSPSPEDVLQDVPRMSRGHCGDIWETFSRGPGDVPCLLGSSIHWRTWCYIIQSEASALFYLSIRNGKLTRIATPNLGMSVCQLTLTKAKKYPYLSTSFKQLQLGNGSLKFSDPKQSLITGIANVKLDK